MAKRTLAEFRPQNSRVALEVDYSILEGEEAAKRRNRLAQMLQAAGVKGEVEFTDRDFWKPLKVFKFRFGRRSTYPRHNAKSLKTGKVQG